MPRFFSNKRLIILLVGVIVLVALIAFSLRDRNHANVPEQAVKDVVGFGQSIFTKPAHFVTELVGNIDTMLNTYEENKRLKERLQTFAAMQAEMIDVKANNDRLRAIIDKQEDLRAFEPIQSTVISRNPDQWEEKLIIDKGTTAGVDVNMAVMTAQGLIGKVVLSTPFTSTVELLSTENSDFRVAAMVVGEEEMFGLIEGFDRASRQLIMKRIDSSFNVKKGMQVTSSGLGGIFPKGILIGEVTEVSTDDYGLTKLAYIRPAASFSMLDHVMVAKRSMTVVDGTDGGNSAGAEGDGDS
ncbi:rod shape-determining protein MreC [Sporosarcina sp. P37]|uniref:rod shape-determining protein MreC n=1 Tax=unclassified Sporosarcina TaxID=2647733 RepID=UPI0009BE93EC|nr:MULTISPECIES: rod shape-determining protein MreC [unclassified Sporosarcina]ARD47034.1 rod shape-determining protein MreC [Sporosarcina sp. P33]ARK23556.1 rod shape-determining protein MreC [Sporosarcina sp. P37]PID18821.1 rod shape-determining protein MreC [Sporosarcina sp. P35]